MKKTLQIGAGLVVLLLLIIVFSPASAQLGETATITDDLLYIVGGTYYNGNALLLNRSNPGGGSPVYIAYMKVDLSSITTTITQARLNLPVVHDDTACYSSVSVDNVGIEVFAVDTSSYPNWSEGTVPGAELPIDTGYGTNGSLGTLDEGAVTGDGWYHISDLSGGSLVQYLEAKRGSTATLRLQISGLAVNPSAADQLLLEDREGTLNTSGCTLPAPAYGTSSTPVLQWGGDTTPLAINLQTMDGKNGSNAITILVISFATVLATSLFYLAKYRKQN